MDQLKVTGLGNELYATLDKLAKSEGISLNEAALKLLRSGAASAEVREHSDKVGSSFDHLIGLWTDQEADEFDAALQDMEIIDESIWQCLFQQTTYGSPHMRWRQAPI